MRETFFVNLLQAFEVWDTAVVQVP